MPGLLRGIARTAVVAGTASAVAGRVRRHQDQHFAEKDAQAEDQQAYDDQDEQQIPEQRSAPDQSSMLDQLKQLGELKSSGVLTEQEFAVQKDRILHP
jgi:cobalamin biosynthesis protein CobT